MVKSLVPALAAAKPALVVWQTGTVDAMQSIDTDQFRAALDQGINIAHSAGADVVLINAQYSPRTDSMIALGLMLKTCVGLHCSKKCRLFDRFSIMKAVGRISGTFDLYAATKKLDISRACS